MIPGALVEGLLIGASLPMRQLRTLIAKVAPTNLPILIEGPTGSGKELVAQAVHLLSGRTGELVPFNVCAIPDTMFEDALFGHVRGGFTGALHDAPGYLVQADRGTAFFDEIGALSAGAQVKLLRAIETGVFRPVGGKRDVRSDFRVVAATNENLDRLAAAQGFRADLRHRLGRIVLRVPALSDRREDIPALAQHFLAVDGAESGARLSRRALDQLSQHDWPGNVRELRAVVVSASALCEGSQIDVHDVAPLLCASAQRPPLKLAFAVQRTLDVLREVEGDAAKAAALLGVNKTTIYRRLRRIGAVAADLGPTRPDALTARSV